jgi:hypothetical protein
MKAWPLVVLLAVAMSACAGHKTAKDSDLPTPNLRHAYRQITWTEAETLIRHCRAREVGQTHSRLVTLSLLHGERRYTQEPQIDDVIDVVNGAAKHCGPITFATE